MKKVTQLCLLLIFSILSFNLKAQDSTEDPLAMMSLEDLMDIVIDTTSMTLVDSLIKSPKSFTISKEDIHTAGAKTISDVLVLCPDVKVDDAQHNTYSIRMNSTRDISATEIPIEYKKLKVFVDSKPIEDYDALMYNNTYQTFDIRRIQRVDVHKTGDISVYNNRIAGIVNIITASE